MELDFKTLDVFTEETFGGNPLGVFPDAAHLPAELMQKVAREMNLAETVFLGPPETPEGTARVRIFTPEVEVPFAGHPTVGAAMVGLEADDLGGDHPRPLTPAMMSCGLPFHVIPIRTVAALGRAVLDIALWREMLAGTWAHHVYLVCPPIGGDVRVRMFAPGSGVPEDPATGSAAAVLGGYLGDASRQLNGTLRWQVAQGEEIGRPSLIRVEVDKVGGRITAVRVGGAATFVSRGIMTVPVLA